MNRSNSKGGNSKKPLANDRRRTNRFYTSLDEPSDYDWTMSDDGNRSAHDPAGTWDDHRSVPMQAHDGRPASAAVNESRSQNADLIPEWFNESDSLVMRIRTNSRTERPMAVDLGSDHRDRSLGHRGRAAASDAYGGPVNTIGGHRRRDNRPWGRSGLRSVHLEPTRTKWSDPPGPRVRRSTSATRDVRTPNDSGLLPRRYLHVWPAPRTPRNDDGTATGDRRGRPSTTAANGNRTVADRIRDCSPVHLRAYYFRPVLHQALYPESPVDRYEPAPAGWQPDVGRYSAFVDGIGRRPNRLPATSERYADGAATGGRRNVHGSPAEACPEDGDIEDVSVAGTSSDEFVSSCSSATSGDDMDTDDDWDQSCSFRFPDDQTRRSVPPQRDGTDAADHHQCCQHCSNRYDGDAESAVYNPFSADDRSYPDIRDTSMPLNSYEEIPSRDHVDWPMEAYRWVRLPSGPLRLLLKRCAYAFVQSVGRGRRPVNDCVTIAFPALILYGAASPRYNITSLPRIPSGHTD
uniref:Uncharacterized protein n=1 Tax=Sipha flava TaxID=143950 RepID=A0A2S2PX00_9HEMI